MKQILIILAAVFVAAKAAGKWKPGLSVRFGIGLTPGRSFFIPLPQSLAEAKKANWVQSPTPAGTPQGLVFYNPSKDDVVVGTFYDLDGKVAGLQIALPEDSYVDSALDWGVQGYKDWSAPVNSRGLLRKYKTKTIYFRAPASFASKSQAASSPEFIGDNIYVTGFNGQLLAIPNTADKVADTAKTGFTKQACIPFMGRHYYYAMNKQTKCTSETMLPWFPLVDPNAGVNQLIGIGFVSFGKLPESSLARDYFERPTPDNVMMIVNNGPDCLRELSQRAGVVTMHIYFVDRPLLINCIGM